MAGDILYTGVIPLNPIPKKNDHQIRQRRDGTRFVGNGERYLDYQNSCGWYLKKGRPKQPINEPVNVQAVFYRKDRRRCDLTNLLEALDDILVLYGIIKDDNYNIIRRHDGSTVLVDSKRPRTEIIITRCEK